MKKIIYSSLALAGVLIAGCTENELFTANEFSDVTFINSQVIDKWDSHIIERGNPISFMDLSQNALSHSWTIDENGCCFIRGEYNRTDTVFDQYIIPGAGNVSEDPTIYVLFQEPGTKTVRLTNTFKDKVIYRGLTEVDHKTQQTFPGDPIKESYYDEERGVHVFDTIMHFKVLDYVTADMTVQQDGNELLKVSRDSNYTVAQSSEWQTITMEVGQEITVSADIYGEPDDNFWKLNAALTEVDSVTEVLQDDPLITRLTATFKASKLVEGNLGYLSMERKSKIPGSKLPDKPASKKSKYFPFKINVIAPSTPFEINTTECKVLDFKKAQLVFNRTLGLTKAQLKDYVASFSATAKIANTEEEKQIEIVGLSLNETSDALILDLQDSIYSDDKISVTYNELPEKPIVDIYGKKLELVNSTIQLIYPEFVITDPINRGFEREHVDGDIQRIISGWFLQHSPVISISSERSYTGSKSLKYDSSVDFTLDSGSSSIVCQSDGKSSELSGPAGRYIVEAWVYIEEGSAMNTLNFGFLAPFPIVRNKPIDLTDFKKNEWVQVSAKYEFDAPLVPKKSKINILFPVTDGQIQQGVMYIDDIKIYRDMSRPE